MSLKFTAPPTPASRELRGRYSLTRSPRDGKLYAYSPRAPRYRPPRIEVSELPLDDAQRRALEATQRDAARRAAGELDTEAQRFLGWRVP